MAATVPNFTLFKPPFCGLDVERYLVEARGGWYPIRRKPFLLWGITHPTFPSTMKKRLERLSSYEPVHDDVPMKERVSYLKKILDTGVPVAIWVRPNKSAPFYGHVVVVTGYNDECDETVYYVMDDREGKTSRDPCLPSGNFAVTEGYLLAVWRNLPRSKTAPALHLN